MPITMIEPVAQAILDELAAYLPGKIATLQPTFTPVLPMPVPTEYVYGHSDFLRGFPVVQVDPVRLPMLNEDVRWQDHEKRIELGLFVTDVARANLARLLDRYARCLLETLAERRKDSAFLQAGRNFDLVFKGEEIDYGSTFPQSGQFLRALFIPMRATRRDVEFH
ncbi:MAG TPA: hypothetical protein VGR85_09015 [Candidatus Limnocylindria bacterium]|jgi:hypothetical protein|nr:hypothetical protein [Candidatus Limnocylindria bacterium]